MKMITKVDATGDACPIPVVKTKKAIRELNGPGVVETLVDNEIAVQNLMKMANQKGFDVKSEKLSEDLFRVTIRTGMHASGTSDDAAPSSAVQSPDDVTPEATVQSQDDAAPSSDSRTSDTLTGDISGSDKEDEKCLVTMPERKKRTVVAVTSSVMGTGNDELGAVLIKSFIYALTQLEEMPRTILFYNGGASLTCEGSALIEDLKSLEAMGVEILTCGTCLNYYKLTEKLAVGGVSNMYEIAELLTQADLVIRP